MINLDTLPAVVAKNQRAQRLIGGSGGKLPDCPRLIVIHTMESVRTPGVAANNATWQRDVGANGTTLVSSHVAVDPSRVWRCVEDDHVAFTQATPWNDCCLSIEQAGRAAQTADEWHDALGAPQLELVAQVIAAWSKRWGIPLRFVKSDELAATWQRVSGVTTHYQLTLASQTKTMLALGYKPGSHTDPGVGYPVDEVIARAAALNTFATKPVPTNGEDVSGQLGYFRDDRVDGWQIWVVAIDVLGKPWCCPITDLPDQGVWAIMEPIVGEPTLRPLTALVGLMDKQSRPTPIVAAAPGAIRPHTHTWAGTSSAETVA